MTGATIGPPYDGGIGREAKRRIMTIEPANPTKAPAAKFKKIFGRSGAFDVNG